MIFFANWVILKKKIGQFFDSWGPKKPQKSKFQEIEKNVRRFSLKMPKPTPPAIGATQLYPKDPLETAKSAQNAIFIKQSHAKK